MWVKVDAITSWARIIDFGNGPNADNVILAASNGMTGRPRFSIHSGGVEHAIDSNVAIPIGKWTHIGVTFSSGTARLYMNGDEVASGSMPQPPEVTRNNCYIGRSNWASDGYFDGAMADLRLLWGDVTADGMRQLTSGVEYFNDAWMRAELFRYRAATAGRLVDSSIYPWDGVYITTQP